MKLISRESEEETDIVNKACLVARVSEKILRSLVASAEIKKLTGNFPPTLSLNVFAVQNLSPCHLRYISLTREHI